MWRKTSPRIVAPISMGEPPGTRLPNQPGHPQTHRGGQRLDQGSRRDGADQASRSGPGQLDVYLQGGCIQLDQTAKIAADRMSLSRISPRSAKQPWGCTKNQEIDQQTMES